MPNKTTRASATRSLSVPMCRRSAEDRLAREGRRKTIDQTEVSTITIIAVSAAAALCSHSWDRNRLFQTARVIFSCFRRWIYSAKAALTASFLLLCPPTARACSISPSSSAKFVAISPLCRLLHILVCRFLFASESGRTELWPVWRSHDTVRLVLCRVLRRGGVLSRALRIVGASRQLIHLRQPSPRRGDIGLEIGGLFLVLGCAV